MIRLMGSLFLFQLCAVFAYTQTTVDPSSIADKVTKKYESLATYQDNGKAEVFDGKNKNRVDSTVVFSTSIKRPFFERIQWSDLALSSQKPESMLVSDGNTVYLYLGRLNQYTKRSASDTIGVAGLYGQAFGSTTIPIFNTRHIILGESKSSQISRATDLQIIDTEDIEKVRCLVVIGRDRQFPITYKFWIGEDDYLIHQQERHIPSTKELNRVMSELNSKANTPIPTLDPSNYVDTSILTRETHLNIQINHHIPDTVFNFTPPKDAEFRETISTDQNGNSSITERIVKGIRNFTIVLAILFFLFIVYFVHRLIEKKRLSGNI